MVESQVFASAPGFRVEECLAIVRSNLGEGFDHLCHIKTVKVYKHPVIGWIVTLRPSFREGERGSMIVDARPIIFTQSVEGREAVLSTSLGFVPDRDYLDAQICDDTIDRDEKVVGVLPSRPNMYYVTGYVNDIAFSLGVHVNPNNEELIELLLEAYLDWLKGSEARMLKSKLAKPKTESER